MRMEEEMEEEWVEGEEVRWRRRRKGGCDDFVC